MENVKRITQSTILGMGWTKTMINELLPEPILVSNPYYRRAPDMKLWEEAEVLKIMETPAYKAALQKAEKRRESSKKAVETKRKKTEEKLIELKDKIKVAIVSDESLIRNTISHKNAWKQEQAELRGDYDYYWVGAGDVDEDTLNRWVVNYIRHNLVAYESSLKKIKGRVGVDDAYIDLKKTVLREIAVAYPKYAGECQRQIDNLDYQIM